MPILYGRINRVLGPLSFSKTSLVMSKSTQVFRVTLIRGKWRAFSEESVNVMTMFWVIQKKRFLTFSRKAAFMKMITKDDRKVLSFNDSSSQFDTTSF